MITKPTPETVITSAEVKAINESTKARAEKRAHYANEDNLEAARKNIFGIKA